MEKKTNNNVTFSNPTGFIGIHFNSFQRSNQYIEKKMYYFTHPVLYYQFQANVAPLGPTVFPDGCIDILCCCDPHDPKLFICGSVLTATSIKTYHEAKHTFRKGAVYFGIRLSSKLSTQIPKISFKETIDRTILFEEIFPKHQYLIHELILQPTFLDKIHYFEQHFIPFLNERNHSSLLDQCIYEITNSMGLISIQQLSDSTGYSTRHIRNKFDETFGLSPKHFAQIIRFQQTFDSILQHQSLADITFQMGYFDQAHLTKNFKHFSTMTPRQLMKHLSKAPI